MYSTHTSIEGCLGEILLGWLADVTAWRVAELSNMGLLSELNIRIVVGWAWTVKV